MTRTTLRRLLLSPTELHVLCAVTALLCCAPILFPELCPEGTEPAVCRYAGILLSIVVLLSAAAMAMAAAVHMMKLNNGRAFLQLCKWGTVWGAACLLFCFIALLADLDAPQEEGEIAAVQTTDTLHPAHDTLTGPSSLSIPISPDDASAATVAAAPNLTKLENEYGDVLKAYLELSPRWSGKEEDDTFYSKPGHAVMVPPLTGGAQSLVHVCFRRLVEGDPLPTGYTVVRPGAEFPADPEQTDDLALDLGRNHYLLLAWRGSAHQETARKAINAAITAIDARMQPLAESPTIDTIQHMLEGRHHYPGTTPEIRVAEPPAQDGTYQAEIYANPGEPGTLLLYIKDMESGKTLRLLNCPARYSDNPEELFRHDIPGSVPEWVRSTVKSELSTLFPVRTPIFAITCGRSHQYFGAAFEVWFRPANTAKPRQLILRRCYKVQPYEKNKAAEKDSPPATPAEKAAATAADAAESAEETEPRE